MIKNETIKSRTENKLYIELSNGNKKLKGNDRVSFLIWNLPAVVTCPHRTALCEKYCYAKKAENQYPECTPCRKRHFEMSRRADFVARMIYTIQVELDRPKNKTRKVVFRIHESGDFYNARYLEKWIDVFSYFGFRSSKKIVFCFYTKCFEYLLNLDGERRETFSELTRRGVVSCSLSLDKSSNPEQVARAMKVKKLFPAVNIYFAIPVNEIETIAHDDTCDCADCAKCGKCVHANGKTIACAIH